MITPPFFAVQKQKKDGVVTLVAANYSLDANDLDPTADLALYVDTLTIPARTFLLPGKNIIINARRVTCAAGATLDTTGAGFDTVVLPMVPPTAANGSFSGDGGKDGLSGGATSATTAKPGQNGGSVTVNAAAIAGNLIIKALGGNGQKGQDGQNGGDGINGADGNDAIISQVEHDPFHPDGWVITPATPGRRGGNAGRGGDAGRSGNGGAGGNVRVNTLAALTSGQIVCTNGGGQPGAPATVGNAGKIGIAGLGGRIAVERDLGGHFHEKIWELSHERTGNEGNGTTARNGDPAKPAAIKGTDGVFKTTTVSDGSTMLANDVAMLSLFLLCMRYGQIAYLSADFATAKTYYQWMASLTAQSRGTGLAAEFAGVHQQCLALISQIGQGLDFYGNPLNYVPVTSLDYYQTALDSILQTGSNIESVYNAYTSFLSGQTREFTRMNDAIGQARSAIGTYKAALAVVYKDIQDHIPVIQRLSDALAAQYAVLMRADATFKKNVERAGQGCTFAGFLALLKTVVGLGNDIYDVFTNPSVKSVTGAIKDFADLGINIDTGKLVLNPIAAAGDPNSVAAAWNSIKPSGDGDAADNKKLVVEEKKFDDAIKPYLSVDGASVYVDAVHDYIGIAESRNTKLLEYTNDCTKYLALTGMIKQKEEEINRIAAEIAQENVPGLISYRNFLYGLYQDFKVLCLKYLYQENRAFIYWSQRDNSFSIADDSFVGLGTFHANLKARIIDQINTVNNPSQPLADIEVVLSANGADKRVDQFAGFRNSRTISFQIGTDQPSFAGWADVLLTSFVLTIPGAVIPEGSSLYAQLWHHGCVSVLDPNGKKKQFTHKQVLAIYQYNIKNGQPHYVAGGALGGTSDNAKRIALSPFATFTIVLPEKFNQNVKVDNVDRIQIDFSGYAQPQLGKARARA